MSTTLGVAADHRAFDARGWPSLRVPPAAYDAWSALHMGLALLERPPACVSAPERWWVSASSPVGEAEQRAAVDGCRSCAVRAECASYAIAARERFGVWGGLTPAERRGEAR